MLQFPDPNKPYVLYTDASNNAYSSVLCQPVDNDQDIRPVAYFGHIHSTKQELVCDWKRSLCCIKKHATFWLLSPRCKVYSPLQSQTSRTISYQRHEDSKTGQMGNAALRVWHHICPNKAKNNIVADAISRLCTIDIYEKAIETQHSHVTKTATTQLDETFEHIQYIDSSPLLQLLNMNSTTLCTLQKQDKFHKNKVPDLHSGINSTFYLNNDSILKWTLVINNLQVHTTFVPFALSHTLLHEFYNCRGHQGCDRTLNALKRRFWWKGMWRDVKYHISNCITCSKNLPNVSCHPQLHLEIPKVPFICIAIDTIDKLSTTSSGNRYALTCIELLTSYIIAVSMPDKTAESVVEAYLSGILSRARASMVCLLDNGSELKTIKWTQF